MFCTQGRELSISLPQDLESKDALRTVFFSISPPTSSPTYGQNVGTNRLSVCAVGGGVQAGSTALQPGCAVVTTVQ